jgi:predicted dehydrogenase
MTTRRSFIQTSAAMLAVPASAPAVGKPDKLNIALIGCGVMGTHHLRQIVQNKILSVSSVCDVDSSRLATAAKIATEAGHAPKAESDIRKVLDDKAVVAVWMATPDHWHAPGAIMASDHGKHVYVEKPCSHNVREGRLMIEAGKRNKVIIQVGTQSRSAKSCIEAIDRIKGGAIGEVLAVKAWNSQLRRNLGKVKSSPPPPHLDFDSWLGPAPASPFYSNRVHGSWRFFRDYGVGDIGNDGIHDIDVGVWGFGLDTLPNRVAALGGKNFFNDDQEWPDTQYMVCEYDVGNSGNRPRQFIFEQRIWSPYVQDGYENGCAFYGTRGMLIIGHSVGWSLYAERNKLVEEMKGGISLSPHHQNFIDSIMGAAKPAAPVEVGHISAGICHLANISTRLRQTIEFDPAKEQVTNNLEANRLLRRTYRDHWSVPKGV